MYTADIYDLEDIAYEIIDKLTKNEMITVAKMHIEREEERIAGGMKDMNLGITISPKAKNSMLRICVKIILPVSRIRGITRVIRDKMSKKLMHNCMFQEGQGGHVRTLFCVFFNCTKLMFVLIFESFLLVIKSFNDHHKPHFS